MALPAVCSCAIKIAVEASPSKSSLAEIQTFRRHLTPHLRYTYAQGMPQRQAKNKPRVQHGTAESNG